MNRFSILASMIVCMTALSFNSAASTTAQWKIERLNDQDAILTMDGSLPFTVANNFEFVGASSVLGIVGTATPTTGDFLFSNSASIHLAFIRDSTFDLSLNILGDALAGVSATGSLLVSLGYGEWDAVGSTGDVLNAPSGLVVGSYEIVSAVPIPPALPLFFAAIVLVGLRSRVKQPV